VIEDTRVGAPDVGIEALVKSSNVRPVKVESLDVLVRDSGSELGLFKSGADSSHRRLRSSTRHAVDSDVDDICSGRSAGEHGRSRDTGSVMGVNVNGHVGELLAKSANEPVRRKRPESAKRKRYIGARDETHIVAASGLRRPAI